MVTDCLEEIVIDLSLLRDSIVSSLVGFDSGESIWKDDRTVTRLERDCLYTLFEALQPYE
jgi:hypothetical protein